MNTLPYTFDLSDLRSSDRNIVGGKAASLGEMISVHLPVPSGFCVTTQAHVDFYQRELPQSLIDEILAKFNSLQAEKVAVRSSAVAEDSEAASWAGQLESYLNVTRSELIDCIRRCWGSIDSPSAAAYAERENVRGSRRAVAVIVQSMVTSDTSGVMFSVNPLNGSEDEIMIEAAAGLGEAVAQGAVNPDRFVIGKSDLRIIEKVVNSTGRLVPEHPASMGRETDAGLSIPCLADEQAQDLAELATRIEKHFGSPQDIEWAIERGRIYLVQSRPITTLNRISISETPDVQSKIDAVCRGVGASRGIVSGRVRTLLDLNEIPSIQQGEILVARSITPDFVQAFPKVAAMITDLGGITSHVAILSRELGIPAVVGTNTATQQLKTGDWVTVNGGAGEVYWGQVRVEPSESSSPQFKRLATTGDDIEDLLAVIANTIPDAGELWPLRPGQLFPYIDMDQALDFYSKLRVLIAEGWNFEEIARLFPHPNSLRLFILNSLSTGLKVASQLKKGDIAVADQVQLDYWIINILRELAPEDPLCLNGTNKIYNQEQISNLAKDTDWTEASTESRTALNQLSGSVFTLLWAFYWDYFPDAGNEVTGPYVLGARETLLIRDWFNVAPREIWSVAGEMPFRSARLSQTYACSANEVFINFVNRVFFEGDAASGLVRFNLQVDGSNITEPSMIAELADQVTRVARNQVEFVNRLSDWEKVRFGARLAHFSFVDFYRHFDPSWYPEARVEATIASLGDRFLAKNKELQKTYTGADRVRMFDPRNTFLPY